MVIAIIQARFSSWRLSGKVLKEIQGKTLLEHMIERVLRAKKLDKIVVATTEKPEDEAIVKIAEKLGVGTFRGSEDDVLDRFYQAAKEFGAAHIVRLTGDCPLMDPEVVDEVVNFYIQNQDKYDYASNCHLVTYPNGMETEVFSYEALERTHKEAKLLSEREHVTPYIYKHPEIFRAGNVERSSDMSNIRITVDNPEDFTVISGVFNELYAENKNFSLDDILRLYREKPEIFSANQNIKRNEGYKKSLTEDLKQR